MIDPITIAVAIAGLFIVGFAFAGIKLLESSAQWIGLGFLIFILTLLAGRVTPTLVSGEFQQDTAAFLNEALNRVTTAPAQPGWYNFTQRIDPNYLIETGYLQFLPPDTNAQTPPERALQPAAPAPPAPTTVPPTATAPATTRGVNPSTPTTAKGATTERTPVSGLW